MTGKIVGRWRVVRRQGHDFEHAAWLCQCECGSPPKAVDGVRLRKGTSRSCGCLQRELAAARGRAKTRHGMTYTPEHRAFRQAKARCTNPKNPSWSDYGGRGIQFLFTSFEEWFAALGYRPTPRHSVDRIDNNGPYAPGNVRWATKKEQSQNTREHARDSQTGRFIPRSKAA